MLKNGLFTHFCGEMFSNIEILGPGIWQKIGELKEKKEGKCENLKF